MKKIISTLQDFAAYVFIAIFLGCMAYTIISSFKIAIDAPNYKARAEQCEADWAKLQKQKAEYERVRK